MGPNSTLYHRIPLDVGMGESSRKTSLPFHRVKRAVAMPRSSLRASPSHPINSTQKANEETKLRLKTDWNSSLNSSNLQRSRGETLLEMDMSFFCLFDIREERVLCSTEQGLLFCSIMFAALTTSYPEYTIAKKKKKFPRDSAVTVREENQMSCGILSSPLKNKNSNTVDFSIHGHYYWRLESL